MGRFALDFAFTDGAARVNPEAQITPQIGKEKGRPRRTAPNLVGC
jgi:hypothetical protein